MSHYSHYARRPRLHPHVRYYPRPEQDEVIENTYSFPLSSGHNSSSSDTTSKKDPTRLPKLAMSFLSTILLLGLAVNYLTITNTTRTIQEQQPSTSYQKLSPTQKGEIRPNILKNETSALEISALETYVKEPTTLFTPSTLTNIADVISPLLPTDIPLFWHVPRSGGSTVKDITALCLMLTQASQVGAVGGHDRDTELMVIEDVEKAGKFLNVDTTTPEGIERAIELELVEFEPLDLIVTPHLHLAGLLFSKERRGRLFTVLRHPVDRAVSMYYYLSLDPTKRQVLGGGSLEEYARSGSVENNWMTRFLSNKLSGELTPRDEAIARDVLRGKCLIGLLTHKAESMQRFEKFFGWKIRGEKMEECHERLLFWNWSNKNKHPKIKEGTKVWKLLENFNTFDIRLYRYAEELFHEQGALFEE